MGGPQTSHVDGRAAADADARRGAGRTRLALELYCSARESACNARNVLGRGGTRLLSAVDAAAQELLSAVDAVAE